MSKVVGVPAAAKSVARPVKQPKALKGKKVQGKPAMGKSTYGKK